MENYKLEHMFELQKNLQIKLGTIDKIKTPSDKQQYINQMILAIQEEAVEIMRETPYKNPEFVKFGWKKGQLGNEENFKDELVDIWHFIMNLAIISGMNAEEFYVRYCKKNGINCERKENNY